MAEADLSKIVSLIMENPSLIEEIKSMVNKNEENSTESAVPKATEETIIQEQMPSADPKRSEKRRQLLNALKPYVSQERGRAIESMMSLADIIGMIRS